MISTDRLSYSDISELEHLYSVIDVQIRNARKNRMETSSMEEDLCYVYRELEIRENRAAFARENFDKFPLPIHDCDY